MHQRHHLATIANRTHQLYKWLENGDIDKPLSNDSWKNMLIQPNIKHAYLNSKPNKIYQPRPKQVSIGT